MNEDALVEALKAAAQVPSYKLYTVRCSYFATGEGMTEMVWLGRATSPEKAIERFAIRFDDYFARGAEVTEGVDLDSAFIKEFLSDAVRRQLRNVMTDAWFEYFQSLHFNMS